MTGVLLAVALSALLAGCAGQQVDIPVAAPKGVPQGAPLGVPQGASQGVPEAAAPSQVPAAPAIPAAVVVSETSPGTGASAPLPPPPPVVEGQPSSSSLTPSPAPGEQAPEEAAEAEELPACVHVPRELCPPANELCRCALVNGTTTGICCDVTTVLQLKESLNCQSLGSSITALHARNITLHSLDVSVLNLTKLHLPLLESLAITDGHIVELKGNLEARNLACLNLSSNSLSNVSQSTFASLDSLQNLDLSGNDLQEVAHLNSSVREFKLDVSGNTRLHCDSLADLIKSMQNLQFRHDNKTYCIAYRTFHWFKSNESIPISSVAEVTELQKECPRGESEPCLCKAERLVLVVGKQPVLTFSVDCSNKGLTKLPASLPKNTISLNVSHNKIRELQELSINPNYANIRLFFADHNQITSITVLEGSDFLENFSILSLQNNNITSLPTYMLSSVFGRQLNKEVQLGFNRFKCDCSTAQSLTMWLNVNSKHIIDYNEVLCDNMREKVFQLDQYKVCTVQSDWTDYVYYLVAAEVLLLILLISKVSYDYWVFKTAGYLPWPASKMPKLPCDWVFES